MRRINRHGWIVLRSIASADGQWCVDFFELPAGGFGFEHFRADPEDQGGWTSLHTWAGAPHATAAEAAQTAARKIGWLDTEPRASEALELWLANNSQAPRLPPETTAT